LPQLEPIIPPERLALLDTLTLYGGAHGGGIGGPDCQHCARELLHEVITGVHADRTPPGVTMFAAILPALNDGPWRDDAHRTAVMRPYLRKFLPPALGGLDPAHDERRIYALVDHIYRKMLPALCDALQLDARAAELRALAPIVDRASAKAAAEIGARALDLAVALDLDLARALILALALDLNLARALARDLDRALARAERAKSWEAMVSEILDAVCSIP
jgi:hypothetical protein